MILFLLCSWSCILIFVWMVKTKYYWTAPPYRLICAFVIAGAVSTVPSLLCNLFLSKKTEFFAFAHDRFQSFMGFWIGAGMGEEFWKISCGILVLLSVRTIAGFRNVILQGRWIDDTADIGDANRILGFVTLGLTFAALENWLSYWHLGFWALVARGFVSVPLHATMGMIHGVAVNYALRRSRAYPLFIGYALAVALHTLFDTWNLFLPENFSIRHIIVPLITVLILWGRWQWLRIPEVPGIAVPKHESIS